ncbi:MAG: HU family DNA-binding protein [Patescibacteria group bacterium]
MNKGEFIEAVASKTGMTKADADRSVNAFIDIVTVELSKKRDVAITGFGTFSISKRAARTGRNPRTGEALKIAAMNVPKFKAGKTLKDAVK